MARSISKTQVVKFIRAGAKGAHGATLRGPQAWSDCASGYTFQAGGEGDKWQDAVMYADQYYICVKSHNKSANNYPGGFEDQANHYWQLGDKIALVAAKLVMTTYGVVKNLGVEAIEMKDAEGNVVLTAKDGDVVCNSGTFNNVKVSGGVKVRQLSYEANKFIYRNGKKIIDCAFVGPGFHTLPKLEPGECRRISCFAPILTKSDLGYSFECEGENDTLVEAGAQHFAQVKYVSGDGWIELVGNGQYGGTMWLYQALGVNSAY